jgi:hypothetical protein
MIRVFIGSNPIYAEQEKVLEYSIREHTQAAVEIIFMRPGENGLTACGCTGFTQFRYCVPELAGRQGFAIYLDVDMIVLADIATLYEYRRAGAWVCLKGGRTEVSVIDCTLRIRPKAQLCGMEKSLALSLTQQYMKKQIPLDWNVRDKVTEGMKLLHFTNLRTQPWLGKQHPNPEAMAVLREYEDRVA